MYRLVVAILCVLPICQISFSQKNFFKNPSANSTEGWNTFAGEGVVLKHDRKVGCAKKGSLHIAYNGQAKTPWQWRQTCDVSASKTKRLKLSAKVKIEDSGMATQVNLVAQCLDANRKQISFVSGRADTSNSEWQAVDIIFQAPQETAFVFVMAYLIDQGKVWWDDFVLEDTEAPLNFPPSRGDASGAAGKLEAHARGLASDIPWVFDANVAKNKARETKRPILVYVRCTDDQKGLASAHSSIEAKDIRFGDDGYMKDLLFRAGPLTDRSIKDLVTDHFVPVCSTYILGSHGRGGSLKTWYSNGQSASCELIVDRNVGATKEGSLSISAKENKPAYWYQTVFRAKPGKLTLRGKVKVSDDSPNARATASLIVHYNGAPSKIEKVDLPRGRTGWQDFTVEVEAAGSIRMVVPTLQLDGKGTVWFDDLSLFHGSGGKDMVTDGAIDIGDMPDPLEKWGTSAKDTVTPALLVIGEDGKVEHRLHRIGALSTHLVERWLRGVLGNDAALAKQLDAQHGAKGEDAEIKRAQLLVQMGRLKDASRKLKKLKSPAAHFVRGLVHLRSGEWAKAEKSFEKGAASDSPRNVEAKYWLGLSLHRQGKEDQAFKTWRSIVSDSPYGRKAALACHPKGPWPWLAETQRLWPEDRVDIDQTETTLPNKFNARQSLLRLLELQRENGSFTGHGGRYWDPAITAIAIDAIQSSKSKLRGAEKKRAQDALDRALSWLDQWAKTPYGRVDAFNTPYVLSTLVREKRLETAALMVKKTLDGQEQDGNWTVYGPHRPASFNTAQCLLALSMAKNAGLEVDQSKYRRATNALKAMRKERDLFPYSTATGHDWMTTDHGAIGRDPLCEHALISAKKGDRKKLEAALERFITHHEELRLPTKKLYDYFNSRGHGGYFFFFSLRNALDASKFANGKLRKRVRSSIREAVLSAREGDGTFMDHYMIGRAYATSMALIILANS